MEHVMGRQEPISRRAEGWVLEAEGRGHWEGAAAEGGGVLVGRQGRGRREGAGAREGARDEEFRGARGVHGRLPGRTSELGKERGGGRARLGAPGLQGRDEVHDGGVGPC